MTWSAERLISLTPHTTNENRYPSTEERTGLELGVAYGVIAWSESGAIADITE